MFARTGAEVTEFADPIFPSALRRPRDNFATSGGTTLPTGLADGEYVAVVSAGPLVSNAVEFRIGEPPKSIPPVTISFARTLGGRLRFEPRLYSIVST